MLVCDLIALLQKYPPDTPVALDDSEYGTDPVKKVEAESVYRLVKPHYFYGTWSEAPCYDEEYEEQQTEAIPETVLVIS